MAPDFTTSTMELAGRWRGWPGLRQPDAHIPVFDFRRSGSRGSRRGAAQSPRTRNARCTERSWASGVRLQITARGDLGSAVLESGVVLEGFFADECDSGGEPGLFGCSAIDRFLEESGGCFFDGFGFLLPLMAANWTELVLAISPAVMGKRTATATAVGRHGIGLLEPTRARGTASRSPTGAKKTLANDRFAPPWMWPLASARRGSSAAGRRLPGYSDRNTCRSRISKLDSATSIGGPRGRELDRASSNGPSASARRHTHAGTDHPR